MATSRVVLPVLDLEQNDETLHKVVLKGAKNYTTQRINNDNQSNTNIQFTVIPPSQNTVIDRKIELEYQFDLSTTGGATLMRFMDNQTDAANVNSNLGLPEIVSAAGGVNGAVAVVRRGNCVGFRQFPLNSIIQNLNVDINGTSISVSPRDYLHAVLQYTNHEFREECLNSVPHHPDTFAGQYQSMISQSAGAAGTNAALRRQMVAENPLSLSSARRGEKGRGLSKNDVDDVFDTLNNGVTTSLRVTLREPFFISPLTMKYGEGMTNINQLKINVQFDASKLNNIFSVCDETTVLAGAGGNTIITNDLTQTFVPNSAKLLVKYYTPQDDIRIPNEIVLPYHQVIRHTHDLNQQLAPNVQSQESVGSNRRLNQVPEALYLWVALKQTDAQRDQNQGDWFGFIENVKIQFQNQVGILSNHNAAQLVEVAQENGCDVKDQAEARQRGYCLKLLFGKDIPLPNNEAPGTRGDYDIQVSCTYRHYAYDGNAANYSLEVNELYVYNGHAIISPNECRIQSGLLDLKDNIEASDMGDKFHGADSYSGGGLFSSLKKMAGKVGHYVKKGKAMYDQGKALYDQHKDTIQSGIGMAKSLMGQGGSITGGSIVGGSKVGGSMVGGAMHGGNLHYMSRRK